MRIDNYIIKYLTVILILRLKNHKHKTHIKTIKKKKKNKYANENVFFNISNPEKFQMKCSTLITKIILY